jgi:transposase
MRFSLEKLFCDVDDFCQRFEPQWRNQLLEGNPRRRDRARSLCLSESLTVVIAFHQVGYRTFKQVYLEHVCVYWRRAFPGLVSYHRFIEWLPSLVLPLCVYLKHGFGACTGISFLDSTSLKVCHNRRITRHRVFAGIAERGKTSVDWFYGFKLHLVVNHQGELLNVQLTPGNTDDRQPVPQLLNGLLGRVFADRGYVSAPLAHQLRRTGVHLVTKLRRNMKNRLMLLKDKLLLRKRAMVEAVIDQLKHSRHRSPTNFLVNLLAGLIAYCHQPIKPAIYPLP